MWKLTFGVVALCGLVALAGGAEPEPPAGAKAELAKLKGTWTVIKATWRGREKKSPGLTYEFDGDRLTRSNPFPGVGKEKRTFQSTFDVKVDTAKRPYRIEMSPGAKFKGTVGASKLVGIYKIEKGLLYLAVGPGGAVPKDFSGKEAMVYVMKKEGKGKR